MNELKKFREFLLFRRIRKIKILLKIMNMFDLITVAANKRPEYWIVKVDEILPETTIFQVSGSVA